MSDTDIRDKNGECKILNLEKAITGKKTTQDQLFYASWLDFSG